MKHIEEEKKKSSRIGSILLNLFCILFILLFLGASTVLLLASRQTSEKTLSLMGYQCYLTDHSISVSEDTTDTLMIVRQQNQYQQGDLLLLSFSQEEQTSYAICKVVQQDENGLIAEDLQTEEFLVSPQFICGKICFSSTWLGVFIDTVSNPENRIAVVAVLCGTFLFLLLLLFLPRFLSHRSNSSEPDAPLYQISSHPADSLQTEVSSRAPADSPLFILPTEKHSGKETEKHPQKESLSHKSVSASPQAQPPAQAFLNSPEPSPQADTKENLLSEPNLSHTEQLIAQIMEEDQIDFSKVEITMTPQELENLKQEILAKK